MEIHLVVIGTRPPEWVVEGFVHYARRLPRNLPFEEERVKPTRFRGDVEAVRAAEAEALLARVKPGDRLIALDERGELPTTEAFTGWIDDSARAGVRRIVFAIGGPYGHGPAVRKAAWKTLALSRMVLNHELARAALVEQLYRASTLLWGGSYHH